MRATRAWMHVRAATLSMRQTTCGPRRGYARWRPVQATLGPSCATRKRAAVFNASTIRPRSAMRALPCAMSLEESAVALSQWRPVSALRATIWRTAEGRLAGCVARCDQPCSSACACLCVTAGKCAREPRGVIPSVACAFRSPRPAQRFAPPSKRERVPWMPIACLSERLHGAARVVRRACAPYRVHGIPIVLMRSPAPRIAALRSPKGPQQNKSIEYGRRGARSARRERGGYLPYLTSSQRRRPGWIGAQNERLVLLRALT